MKQILPLNSKKFANILKLNNEELLSLYEKQSKLYDNTGSFVNYQERSSVLLNHSDYGPDGYIERITDGGI